MSVIGELMLGVGAFGLLAGVWLGMAWRQRTAGACPGADDGRGCPGCSLLGCGRSQGGGAENNKETNR